MSAPRRIDGTSAIAEYKDNCRFSSLVRIRVVTGISYLAPIKVGYAYKVLVYIRPGHAVPYQNSNRDILYYS